MGDTTSSVAIVGPRTALVAATKPSCSACGTSIRRPVTSPAAKTCGAEVRRCASTRTNPARIGLDAGGREVEPGGVGRPAHRHDHERGLGAARARRPSRRPSARRPASSRSDSIEPKSSCTPMPAARKASATAADTSSSSVGRMRAAAWNSSHARAEGVEDRRDLHAGRAAADDQHRRRNRRQAPGIAVRRRQLESGDREPPADAARAEDDLLGAKAQPALRLDGVRVHEARGAGVARGR